MKKSAIILVFLAASTFGFVPSVLAQEIGSPRRDVAFLRAGYFYGRSGTAEGSTGYLELNPSRWVGFFGLVSHSRNESEVDGGQAAAWDVISGVGVTAHAPELKGFLFSPFFQIEYQCAHDTFTLPLGDGTSYEDARGNRRHLFTVGASVDRAIVKNGPRWAARVGRNLGDGLAVNNAGGLYLVGGIIFPLDHPVELGRSFKKMIGMKSHAGESTAARP